KVMYVLAGVGTFLSFFHQGSLGGLYGVLRGRPFAFREGFAIWPSTFFLFILSAIAVGPSFMVLTTAAVEKMSQKRLVRPEVLELMGKISGILLIVYTLAKSVDTLVWMNSTAPSLGFSAHQFYLWKPFGTWLMFAEIVVFGLTPALLLLNRGMRRRRASLLTAAALASAGIVVNRFVLTIQTLAVPTLPFDRFMLYTPNWQEMAAFLAVIAYGVIVYSLSFRYLPLFPQEKELAR
ncbi:MAG: molybdopterin oxidoreductase, partial [Acidobacteria bacterium]|nr:molybdopterin oxidoreductase [Acidobacteriota bacterium]